MLALVLICLGGVFLGVGLLVVGLLRGAAKFEKEANEYANACTEYWEKQIQEWFK